MKQAISILVVILILVIVAVLLSSGAPKDIEKSTVKDVEVTENSDEDTVNGEIIEDASSLVTISKFQFTGYGPGKEHVGTFDEFAITDVVIEDGSLQSGVITFNTKSIQTDAGDSLNSHLCSEDFFECDTYPNIVFELTGVSAGAIDTELMATGNISFHGVTKQVSFKINKNGNSISADFTIDTKPFNFKYLAIDKDVRIEFEGEITE